MPRIGEGSACTIANVCLLDASTITIGDDDAEVGDVNGKIVSLGISSSVFHAAPLPPLYHHIKYSTFFSSR